MPFNNKFLEAIGYAIAVYKHSYLTT